jgi:hypothetical protein
MPTTFKNDIECFAMLMKLVKTAPNEEAELEAMRLGLILKQRMSEKDIIKAIKLSMK